MPCNYSSLCVNGHEAPADATGPILSVITARSLLKLVFFLSCASTIQSKTTRSSLSVPCLPRLYFSLTLFNTYTKHLTFMYIKLSGYKVQRNN